MKKLNQTLFTENGWKHLLMLLCLLYIIMYWGLSEYGRTTIEWPTSMVHSFASQTLMGKVILGFAGGFLINAFYEFLALIFAKVPFSFYDCFWAGIGAVIGIFIFLLFPSNLYLFILFAGVFSTSFWIFLQFINNK
jgi:hypothetical protein